MTTKDLVERLNRGGQYEIVEIDPKLTVVSTFNPHFDVTHHGVAFDALVTSIRDIGQTDDALGSYREDGTLVLFTGSRRRAACIQLGIPLRVKVYPEATGTFAFMVAHADEQGRANVSIYDRGRSYVYAIAQNVAKDESGLAEQLNIDKSTVNRAIRFAEAPSEILDLIDPRSVSATDWYAFGPLLEDAAKLEIILAHATLLAKSPPATAKAVFKELASAVEPEVVVAKTQIVDGSGKRIGSIKPTARGGSTIAVATMGDLSPIERTHRIKAITAALKEASGAGGGKPVPEAPTRDAAPAEEVDHDRR